MKKLLLAFCLSILMCSVSFAARTITLKTDPQTGVYSYKISGIGVSDIIVPAQADGSLSYDISTIAAGSFNISVVPYNLWDDPAVTPATISISRVTPNKSTGLGILIK